ncbi:hypothetical protein EVAR_41190_1 [Eumeta japonica]|uniref:Uncharacterized protein n=1 Tax=Eumeta variegata TaxID=151549 RepID=A0A4C1WQT8_EUMVA|nr:hypothetical protein EVAR_41190_1 [Eumeta japonica]
MTQMSSLSLNARVEIGSERKGPGDEAWIFTYDPETKQQSTMWVFQDEPNATKAIRAKGRPSRVKIELRSIEKRTDLLGTPDAEDSVLWLEALTDTATIS